MCHELCPCALHVAQGFTLDALKSLSLNRRTAQHDGSHWLRLTLTRQKSSTDAVSPLLAVLCHLHQAMHVVSCDAVEEVGACFQQ